jgi:acetoacetyl-CoA synthetase
MSDRRSGSRIPRAPSRPCSRSSCAGPGSAVGPSCIAGRSTSREAFWNLVWDFCEVRGTRSGFDARRRRPDAGRRLVSGSGRSTSRRTAARARRAAAISFWGEDQVKRRMSRRELYDLVSRIAQALRAAGVTKGDRVAGYLPNLPESIAAMLATTSIGAIWSSCSPDFGVQGVLDRFGQIEPKVLFCADGYFYSGKAFDSLEKVRQILPQLPSVRACVVIPTRAARARPGRSCRTSSRPTNRRPSRSSR